MARYTSNSFLNSLKGKIWVAAAALAFFTCTFGLISYLVVSFIVNDPLYGVFIPFFLLSLTILGFGWWISTEVLRPIEKVSLLARSLERSATTTLPKTTGALETDELLETLHRSSLQMQKFIILMDEVSSGNTNVALTPFQNSDRLTAAFQRLLVKVTDSIGARANLDKLKKSIDRLSEEASRIHKHNLDADLSTGDKNTKEIAETIRFLVQSLYDIVALVRSDSQNMRQTTVDVRRALQSVIQTDENLIQEMNVAALVLKEIPTGMKRVAANFAGAVESANRSIEKAHAGSQSAQESIEAAAILRRQLQEAVSRLNRLSESSHEIGKIARTVGDLAHRTNTIALNASIQAGELGDHGRGFAFVAEEIERLATRAEATNKQIATLNKGISAEIAEVERTLRSTVEEAAGLTKFAVQTSNSLDEIEKHVTKILNLQNQLTSNSADSAIETENAFEAFANAIDETELVVDELRISERSLASFTTMIENMVFAVEDFKLPQPGESLYEDESDAEDAEYEEEAGIAEPDYEEPVMEELFAEDDDAPVAEEPVEAFAPPAVNVAPPAQLHHVPAAPIESEPEAVAEIPAADAEANEDEEDAFALREAEVSDAAAGDDEEDFEIEELDAADLPPVELSTAELFGAETSELLPSYAALYRPSDAAPEPSAEDLAADELARSFNEEPSAAASSSEDAAPASETDVTPEPSAPQILVEEHA